MDRHAREQAASPGRTIEEAGSSFASNLDSISERIAEIPLVGETLQGPFASAAGAGRTLQSAGQTHQEVIHTLAIWLGVLFAIIPILYVLINGVFLSTWDTENAHQVDRYEKFDARAY